MQVSVWLWIHHISTHNYIVLRPSLYVLPLFVCLLFRAPLHLSFFHHIFFFLVVQTGLGVTHFYFTNFYNGVVTLILSSISLSIWLW